MKTNRVKEAIRRCLQETHSLPLLIGLSVILIGYTVFFTSKMWFPDMGDLVAATPLYERMVDDNYEIYVSQWSYAKDEQVMQVILEVVSKEVLATPFIYGATERTMGKIKVVPVQETYDYVVLRLLNVPAQWREISLRVGRPNTESQVKFYTNIEAIKQVKTIPEKSEQEYEVERLKAQLTYDQVQQKEKVQELTKLKTENKLLEDGILELETGVYLSDVEVQRAEETISKAKSQIQLNADNMQSIDKDVKELEQRSANIQVRIAQLQGVE